MADPIDLDSLSDDEVLALGPEAVETLQQQENEGVNDEPDTPVEPDPNDVSSNEPDPNIIPDTPPAGDDKGDKSDDLPAKEDIKDEGGEDPDKPGIEPTPPASEDAPDPDKPGTGEEKPEDQKPDDVKPKVEDKPAEKKKEEKTKDDKPAVQLDEETTEAVESWKEILKPFKADGKMMQVRNAQDAIRLMQMGVNFSRRNEAMKPMKIQDQMLRDNGIDSVAKLNEVIDLFKGSPEAVQKFLKEKGIDPLDLDVTKDSTHVTPNYQGDPKDIAFREAVDTTMAAEGGRELLQEINSPLWDDTSKDALRDQPSIFENLLAQKESGVYDKVKGELDYQQNMGFLKNVPFLQAYHQVSDAMQKVGALGSKDTEVQSGGDVKVPIDTGTRKAADTKNVQPNQKLSSTTQPSAVIPQNDNVQNNEPDYSSMSDEEIMKLAPPV